MAEIKNWAINVDKLKVCYKITDEIYTYLSTHHTRTKIVKKRNDKEEEIRILDEVDFYLVFFDEEETKMFAHLNVRDKNGDFVLGTFIFNCGKKYKNLAFFTFENDALYRIFTKDFNGNPHNYIFCLQYVANYYGMIFNTITTLEVAFDSDFNFVKKIRQMIKDVEQYELYLNGRKIADNAEIMQGYGEFYSRNRMKLQSPTLYFSQSKSSDMQMRVYDKARELNESTPHKIERYKNWLDWNKTDKIYRIEIVFHATNVKDFFGRYATQIPKEMGGHENVLSSLCMSNFLMSLFIDATDRLIYFKDKKTKKNISLIDLVGI